MDRALILFTRVPLPGKTKTRLLPRVSPERCCQLHCAFLRDIGQVCAGMAGCRLLLCHAPEGEPAILRELVPGAKAMFSQVGDDLGARMDNAIRAALADGAESCVLIGADLPELSTYHLEEGFRLLENHEAVLGPTTDGGYYLVGVRRPQPGLFRVKGYGGSNALEQTLAAASAEGLDWALAPACADVDTPEDLDGLVSRLAACPKGCPHTRRLLAQWGMLEEVE